MGNALNKPEGLRKIKTKKTENNQSELHHQKKTKNQRGNFQKKRKVKNPLKWFLRYIYSLLNVLRCSQTCLDRLIFINDSSEKYVHVSDLF